MKYIMMIANARRMANGAISRFLTSTLSFSRAAFKVVTRATKTVVTFNPPPVDIGAAPITIRINVSIKVGGANVAISATLNPAVLGVTAPKNAFASFPRRGRSPKVLSYSKRGRKPFR